MNKAVKNVIFLVWISLFAGCSQRTSQFKVPAEIPERFSRSGQAERTDRWWTAFGDTVLNQLLEHAIDENFDIRSAWYRLKAAQAVADRESAALYPFLDAFGKAEKIRRPAIENRITESEGLSLGLATEYEIDLWGRMQAGIDAEDLRAAASLQDYQTAVLSVSAEIVRAYVQLAETQNQIALIEQQIDADEKVLQLIKTRFAGGQARRVDIVRQEQLVEATREEKINASLRQQLLRHRLRVLLGAPAQEPLTPDARLPSLPPLPETGLASGLVQRRPDVRQAFFHLQAADRDLAMAIRNRYPRLALSASVSTTGEGNFNLFENWASTLFAGLTAPLFRGGELEAETERTRAVKNEWIYRYSQVILEAFREVEDALIQEERQVHRLQSLEKQVSLAKEAYEQLRIEYMNGAANYIDVLTALNGQQQLQRDLLSAQRLLVEYRIALYRALAGGIDTGKTD